MLDFKIYTFLNACETLNFSKTAETMHITQPAVSQQIHALEAEFGETLFSREGKKLQLAAAGRILRDAMTTMRNDEARIRTRIRESRPGRHRLTFGVTMTIGEFDLIAPMAAFIHRHPHTDLRVRYGNTQKLLADLNHGRIDFAVVEGYYDPGYYEKRVYRSVPYIPVCAAGHRFARPIRATRDLLGERILIREMGSGTRAILERSLAVMGLAVTDFAHFVEVGNMHAIIALLERDCGISFLYQTAAEEALARGTLRTIPLTDFKINHDFTILWNRHSVLSDQIESVSSELVAAPGARPD